MVYNLSRRSRVTRQRLRNNQTNSNEGEEDEEAGRVFLTLHIHGELLSVAVDVSDPVGLDTDVGFHQRMLLQQVLHAQQMLPIVLREQQHLREGGHVSPEEVGALVSVGDHDDNNNSSNQD